MELKELKKEVLALPELRKHLKSFQESWIKQIKDNSNQHMPFLNRLDSKTKAELNQKLAAAQPHLQQAHSAHDLHERLHSHATQLVELKLTTFNGDSRKAAALTNLMLHDDYHSLNKTVSQAKSLNESLSQLHKQYEEVNQLLSQKLSLEEMVYYMGLPHKRYLQSLLKIGQQQQRITRDLGRHFVTIAQEVQVRKNMGR
jgi:hypothetical protein